MTKVTQFVGFLGAICKFKKFRANRWSTAIARCESTIRKSARKRPSDKQTKSYFERGCSRREANVRFGWKADISAARAIKVEAINTQLCANAISWPKSATRAGNLERGQMAILAGP